MGAQASTIEGGRGGADSDVESVSSIEETAKRDAPTRKEPGGVLVAAETLVVATSVTAKVATRPPVAPPKPPAVVDRVVEIQGAIKHAFPLQSLGDGGDAAESGDFGGDFSLGSGPCGRDAARVVAWEVQLHDSYQTCFVFLYDKWADTVAHFQRHYKVHIRGLGLVAIDHWDIGHDTEDVKRCYVVAEALLLKRTMDRSPRLLPKPRGVTIEVAYEEPQRVPESDQVRYQPEKVIHARDLYGGGEPAMAGKEKAVGTAGQKKKEQAATSISKKPNPRGKRTLREIDANEAANAKITTPSSYMYTPLAELIPGYANVYGVVVNMSLPKRSEGYDYYMSLHIVDESCPRREDALQVMVFLPTLEQMPRISHVGDVVRFHKIRINRYQDRLQGVCNSRATRYLVLRHGPTGTQDIEQQTSSTNWTFEKYDEERFRQIDHWAQHALRVDTTLPPGCPQPSRLLGDMQYAESFADVVVRVLHVQEPYGEFTAARFIIWDGSGTAAECQDLYEKLKRERQTRTESVVFIPEGGLLMEVIVDSCWIVMQTMGLLPKLTSHWCRFRNLAVSSEQGEHPHRKQWFELHFREVSSIMLVPESMADVLARVPQKEEGHAADEAFEDEQPEHEAAHSDASAGPQDVVPRVVTQVPAFIIDKVPVGSIKTVLSSVHVPRKYHCCARVVKLWPSAIEHLAKPKSATDPAHIYSFAMRLEDATGQLDVIVHGDDAEKFLHGIPPCDLTKNTASRAVLQKRLSGLLALAEPAHFCVKSYKVKAAATSPGDDSVRFRLFDTTLHAAAV